MGDIDQPLTGLFFQLLRGEQFKNQIIKYILLCGLLHIFYSTVLKPSTRTQDRLPVVNRLFSWQPRVLARLRWALFAHHILQRAHTKFNGKPYLLDRGDAEYVVLPARYIAELNRIPVHVLETRRHHSFSLLGHLTGMHVILKTSYHVRTLLGRVSPATGGLTPSMARRMTARLSLLLSQDPHVTQIIDPVDVLVRCVSEGLALTLFGPPICDDPELVRLCHEHTKNVFTIAFCMRIVPAFLQPFAVWLLPAKWRLERGWSTWDRIVIPEVRRRLQEADPNAATRNDLISWMIQDAKSSTERDERVLTHLSAAVIAGATYSTANLISEALVDLVARPEILEQLRDEIRQKHIETGGQWDMTTLDSLPKLESALKETSRLTPGAMFVYQRAVAKDVTLSDGLQLVRGQFITTLSQEASMAHGTGLASENATNSYDGLRFYNQDPERHLHVPFRGLDGDVLTWGSGRWACPGRVVANMMIKILLVKLLDEYEFSFVEGRKPSTIDIHEFIMLSPMARIKLRRREECLGIKF
ncbi:cytochrome P450 [Astrocystis sublimbata]|nr:cytochrome P450 [Astrocystis sublimbata]